LTSPREPVFEDFGAYQKRIQKYLLQISVGALEPHSWLKQSLLQEKTTSAKRDNGIVQQIGLYLLFFFICSPFFKPILTRRIGLNRKQLRNKENKNTFFINPY
jgi:hypothetical protein